MATRCARKSASAARSTSAAGAAAGAGCGPTAGAAAGARVAVGHVRRRALVADGDEPDRLVAERGDDAVELDARKPERHLHALAGERLHDRFTTGHPCHRQLLAGILGDSAPD